MDRCIDSYLKSVRARTVMDVVNAAIYLESAVLDPYVEYGQLFITKKWRMRCEYMTPKEISILNAVTYMPHIDVTYTPDFPNPHNLQRRMGPSFRSAFDVLYTREAKNPASAIQTSNRL